MSCQGANVIRGYAGNIGALVCAAHGYIRWSPRRPEEVVHMGQLRMRPPPVVKCRFTERPQRRALWF